MWKHGPEEFLFRGFQAHRDDEALNQFGDFGSDHMGADEFSGFGVEEVLTIP